MTRKKPRIAALVPMRHASKRVPGKNYRPLAGRPLFHHIVEALLACELVDEVVIDTDSDVIRRDAAKHFPGVRLIARPPGLAGDTVPMTDVIMHDVQLVDADFYVQTHSTNPLVPPETITRAIETYVDASPEHDALFSVTEVKRRFWFSGGRAVNHDPAVLLRTQDLAPIYEENSCLYVFDRATLEKERSRTGRHPIMFPMARHEAWDIDDEMDFAVAEFLFERARRLDEETAPG